MSEGERWRESLVLKSHRFKSKWTSDGRIPAVDYLQELKNVVFCFTDLSRCYEAASDVDNVTSHGSFCLRNADKIFFSLQCRNGNRQEKANEQWGFTCGGFFCCFFYFQWGGMEILLLIPRPPTSFALSQFRPKATEVALSLSPTLIKNALLRSPPSSQILLQLFTAYCAIF